MPGISRRDVDELTHLAQELRRTAGAMTSETGVINNLVAGVDRTIAGTATGKDREFLQFLNGAAQGVKSAIAACEDAALALTNAAGEAAEEVRKQERQERKSRRV